VEKGRIILEKIFRAIGKIFAQERTHNGKKKRKFQFFMKAAVCQRRKFHLSGIHYPLQEKISI